MMAPRSTPPVYPFSAIVGQEPLKLALLLNAIDPSIGGALIRGEKGTAKSTAVRALAALLPPIVAVAGCPLQCAPDDPPEACPWCAEHRPAGAPPLIERPVPLVELPVAATEDRVAGTLDLEAALHRGARRFEPGLLAAANRGVLYIDEVNLLPDHLIDAILDAAATAVHHVEREGISVTHPARFVLVGTMNPEEGELRPQLLDRFGLAVEVTTPRHPAERAQIVRRRIAFDADPAAFIARWEPEEAKLRHHLRAARARLRSVLVPDALLDLITRICAAYEVDGLRADIVLYKAAAALAALDSRTEATIGDVRRAALLALPHRRRHPFDEDSQLDPTLLDDLIAEHERAGTARSGDQDQQDQDEDDEDPEQGDAGAAGGAGGPVGTARPDGAGSDAGGPHPSDTSGRGSPSGLAAPPAASAAAPLLEHAAPPAGPGERRIAPAPVAVPGAALLPAPGRPARRRAAGDSSRSGQRAPAPRGAYVRSITPRGRPHDVAFDATLRAAAARLAASRVDHHRLVVTAQDLRQKLRQQRRGRLLLFVVDCSGSMAARRRLALAKGTVSALLRDAYRGRDEVGLIAFRGTSACLALPPTRSVAFAARCLDDLPAGGRTPLAAALLLAERTLARYERREAGRTPLVVVLSDGKANVAAGGGEPWQEALRAAGRLRRRGTSAIVVDAEDGTFSLGLVEQLSAALGAPLLRVRDGMPTTLVEAMKWL